MLGIIKSYIKETSDMPFDEFYQRYIFEVQDMNIQSEVNSIKPNDIISLDKLISKLHSAIIN